MLQDAKEPQALQRKPAYEVPPAAQGLRITEQPALGISQGQNKLSLAEEYELIVQQLRVAITTAHNAGAAVLVDLKWTIGEVISTSHVYEKNQWGAGKFVQAIAEDLSVPIREIYSCVEFYQTALESGGREQFIERLGYKGEVTTWSYIKRNLSAAKAPRPDAQPKRSKRKTLETYSEGRGGETWTEKDHRKIRYLLGLAGAADPDDTTAPKARQRNTAALTPIDETSANKEQWT